MLEAVAALGLSEPVEQFTARDQSDSTVRRRPEKTPLHKVVSENLES